MQIMKAKTKTARNNLIWAKLLRSMTWTRPYRNAPVCRLADPYQKLSEVKLRLSGTELRRHVSISLFILTRGNGSNNLINTAPQQNLIFIRYCSAIRYIFQPLFICLQALDNFFKATIFEVGPHFWL
jgi:hypothetical protein